MLPVALMMQLYRVKNTLTIIAKLLPYKFFYRNGPQMIQLLSQVRKEIYYQAL